MTGSNPPQRDTSPPGEPSVDIDDAVAALLRSLPEPGPLPADIARRIEAALEAEQLARGATPIPEPEPTLSSSGADTLPLTPIESGRRRSGRPGRPGRSSWLIGAAAAAGLVAVALGGSFLQHRNAGTAAVPRLPDAVVGSAPSTDPVGVQPTTGTLGEHIYASRTAYSRTNLATMVATRFTTPGTPLHPLAGESPALGPLASPTGVASCAGALSIPAGKVVMVDLATFEDQPAAVIVTSGQNAGTVDAYVVIRTCPAGGQLLLDHRIGLALPS